jgi:hypothetical protein
VNGFREMELAHIYLRVDSKWFSVILQCWVGLLPRAL